MYGFNSAENMTREHILAAEKKYKIPPAQSFIADTILLNFLDSIKATHPIIAKDHRQGLQALYYNEQGELISFHINCYASGFPNLKWNIDKVMETFPPKTKAPLDSILFLEKHLSLIPRSLHGSIMPKEHKKYTILIYWSYLMGRQSKHLLKTIRKNLAKGNASEIDIIYINSDNLLMHN